MLWIGILLILSVGAFVLTPITLKYPRGWAAVPGMLILGGLVSLSLSLWVIHSYRALSLSITNLTASSFLPVSVWRTVCGSVTANLRDGKENCSTLKMHHYPRRRRGRLSSGPLFKSATCKPELGI